MASLQAAERAFVVVASDGLWDVVSEERAAGLVLRAVAEDSATGPGHIADILLNQAVTLRSRDDISIMVLQVFPTA